MFFFSDNGGPTMAGTTINGRSTRRCAGRSVRRWRAAFACPSSIRWKGRLPEGWIDARPVIQLDVLPTALAAAGVEPKADWKLDGVNLLPYLSGKQQGDAARGAVLAAVRAHGDPQRRVEAREDRWKDRCSTADTPSPICPGRSYSIWRNDIGEKNDLATTPAGEGQGAGGRLAALEQGDGEAALDAGRRRTRARGGAVHGRASPTLILMTGRNGAQWVQPPSRGTQAKSRWREPWRRPPTSSARAASRRRGACGTKRRGR